MLRGNIDRHRSNKNGKLRRGGEQVVGGKKGEKWNVKS
jgi:hypothetical protein